MGSMQRIRRLTGTYGPLFVFIPGLMVAHWAWFRLQDNELFVSREQRNSHPLMIKADKFFDDVKGKFSSWGKTEE